jgi:hypothetical protein
MTVTIDMARAKARELIRPYIERGDPPEDITRRWMGGGSPIVPGSPGYSYTCMPEGALWSRFLAKPLYEESVPPLLRIKAGEIGIVIWDADGNELAARFKLAEIAAEIRSGVSQLDLFGSAVTP